MIKIGITGSIASGKTSASKILSYKRGPLFSADKIVKALYLKSYFKRYLIKKFSIEKNLISWANQGILLLNSTLTVELGKANSHANTGWSLFTDQILRIISAEKDNLVFILWGKHASKKEYLINSEKHLILKSAHPSPLSAYKGFFGCKHFSKANKYLKKNNLDEINWTS